jgi:hypothetical protein
MTAHEEEELGSLHEKCVKLAVITETKRKLKGTKETEHYIMIYNGVNRNTQAQGGVVVWIHKSV